ncbi:MAG: YibE/F family protein, partial [Lentisphaeria bacterium]|nr:YibE/F family protein [Lentisphaeria bacterium]
MIRKAAARDGLFCLVVLFCCCGLYLLPPPPSLLRQEGTSALAYVTKVDNADIRQHGLIRAGSQQLEVEVADGEWKGRRFRAGNELRGQLELDKEFRVGDLAVVTIPPDASPESSVLVARDHYRAGWELVLFGGFCLLLVLFGGWVGLKALF